MRFLPFSRFIVHDKSMMPTFKPGDHVLIFNWTMPHNGDVFVFKDGNEYLLKRVKEVRNGLIIASADNREASTRIFNIKPSLVVGKVLLIY